MDGARNYLVSVRNIRENKIIVPEQDPKGTSFVIAASQLSAGHQYGVSVASVDALGNKKTSYLYFTIKDPKPVLIPPDVSVNGNQAQLVKVANGDLQVSWDPINGANQYSYSVTDFSNKSSVKQGKTKDISIKVDANSLKAGDEYRVVIAAEDTAGNQGPPSYVGVMYGTGGSNGNGTVNGFTLKDFPLNQTDEEFTGIAHYFKGEITSQLPLDVVNLVVSKNGQQIDDQTYRRILNGESKFDLSQMSFPVYGGYATPGLYTFTLYAKAKDQEAEKLGAYNLNIKSPIYNYNIEDYKQQIYMAAWLDEKTPQQNGNYPPIYVNLYKEGTSTLLKKYLLSDKVTDEFGRLAFERYVDASDFPVGVKLTAVFYVDGFDEAVKSNNVLPFKSNIVIPKPSEALPTKGTSYAGYTPNFGPLSVNKSNNNIEIKVGSEIPIEITANNISYLNVGIRKIRYLDGTVIQNPYTNLSENIYTNSSTYHLWYPCTFNNLGIYEVFVTGSNTPGANENGHQIVASNIITITVVGPDGNNTNNNTTIKSLLTKYLRTPDFYMVEVGAEAAKGVHWAIYRDRYNRFYDSVGKDVGLGALNGQIMVGWIRGPVIPSPGELHDFLDGFPTMSFGGGFVVGYSLIRNDKLDLTADCIGFTTPQGGIGTDIWSHSDIDDSGMDPNKIYATISEEDLKKLCAEMQDVDAHFEPGPSK
ncbi:hypothetical protein JCM15765_24610 [Paradesulfitobacterium aromaticivorans]